VHKALLRVCTASLRDFKALFLCGFVALLREYRALMHVFRALLRVHGALFANM